MQVPEFLVPKASNHMVLMKSLVVPPSSRSACGYVLPNNNRGAHTADVLLVRSEEAAGVRLIM
jgi:hypothetical protein